MAADTVSCPYCNSSVPLLRPSGARQRLRCPRCHELFPYRAGEEGTPGQECAQALDPGEAGHAFGEGIESQLPRPWSNRSVALIILSVMGMMAAIGFAFAWFTVESRRQRDHLGETSAPALPRDISVAPAKLAALGYLPAGTDAIAAIHIRELMAQPQWESILQLMRADQANFGIHRLEQLTGLTLEDLDHVVLGLKVHEGDLPLILMIAQTRLPYDLEAVRAALNARRAITLADKTVYPIALEQVQLGGILWCAGERTLVFSLRSKDLADVPAQPNPRLDRFPAQVQKCLTDLGEGTQAWVVGCSTSWEEVLAPLQLLGLAEADRRALNQVVAFCGRLHCDGEVNGQIEVECADAAGAIDFDKYLDRKGLRARRLKEMAQNWPRAAALLGELAQTLVRERNGEREGMRLKASTQSLRQALSQSAVGGGRTD